MIKKWMAPILLLTYLGTLFVMPVSAEQIIFAKDLRNHAIFYSLENASETGAAELKPTDYLGNEISLPHENLEMPFFYSAKNLPSSYDLRKQTNASGRSLSTAVKHQGFTGFCWAFGAMSAAESSVLKQNLERTDWMTTKGEHQEMAFSPVHLGQTAFYDTDSIDGISGDYFYSSYTGSHAGNDWIAAAAMSSGRGVQLEQENPFSFSRYGVDAAQQSVSYYALKNFYNTALDYSNPTSSANASNIKTVKEWLMEYGACTVHCSPDTIYKNADNTLAGAYSTTHSGQGGHVTTIIGWDDEFDFSIFPGLTIKPPAKGAWLIKDSYGDSLGIDGYYYLSYYDTGMISISCYQMMDATEYDNNYQYTGMIGNVNINPQKAANVFTAKKEERLTQIGIFTVEPMLSYTATVYTGVTNSPEDGTLAATIEGVFESRGYHTISLPMAVSLSAGERFSVVFELLNVEEESGNFWFELDKGPFFAGEKVSYASEAGQSYLYENLGSGARWYDTTNVLLTQTQTLGNVMIRALTVNVSETTDKTALVAAVSRAQEEISNGLSNDAESEIRSELFAIFERDLQVAKTLSESETASQQELDNAAKNLTAIVNILNRDREKTISTADELYRYAQNWMQAENGCVETVKLGADIILNAESVFTKNEDGYITSATGAKIWTPFGSGNEPYPATFDGQDHSISGLFVTSAAQRGLFGKMTGVVKNLTLKDSLIYTDGNSGALVGCLYQGGEVLDCNIRSVSVIPKTTVSNIVGGAVGLLCEQDLYFEDYAELSPPKIKHTAVEDCFVVGDTAVGGVVGRIFENGILDSGLSFTGRLEARLRKDSFDVLGPIVGRDETKAGAYPSFSFETTGVTMKMVLLSKQDGYTGSLSLLSAPEYKGIESLSSTGMTLTKESEQFYTFSDAPWTENVSVSANLYSISDYLLSYQNGVVTVLSPRMISGNLAILAARYLGNDLSEVIPISVSLKNGKQSLDISQQFAPQAGETYQIMLWNMASIQPLAPAVSTK